MSDDLNTHGVIMPNGKHKGERLTCVPVSYLRWMANESNHQFNRLAKAEIARRGHKLPTIELSGHAIDNASFRVRKIWHETRKEDEGLYSWLMRITEEAIEQGERLEGGKIKYMGMKLVVDKGEEFPVLKTVMRVGK